jgi:ABC-type sugar transport system permease subunit
LSADVVARERSLRSARRGFTSTSLRLFGRDWRIAWLFFLPSALLLGGLVAYPLVSAVWTSMHIAVGPRMGAFVGLDNYIDLWTDDDQFRSAVWQTVRFTFYSVFFKFWLGLAAAVILHQKIKFRNILTALVLLPWIVPEVVTALAWRGIFDPVFGGLNGMLLFFGVIDKGTPSCTTRPLSTARRPGASSCTSRCRACATSSSSARCCRRSGRSTTSASSTC